MRINCPGCAATYEVPDAQLGAARGLRCARCDRQWRAAGCAPVVGAEPPEIAVVRAASTLLRQSAMRAAAPPPPPPAATARRLPVWGIGWAASLLLLLGMIGGVTHWRRPIMHAWPPSMRLYAAIGAPQSPNQAR
ncbi:zinc-ribbon domain-containing protein [Lichenicoccus sp.]|uniref:zinc-ribbon domain-containing protein n=1 Tax=Lichenicoccus sp. TaxID=2781899 RepID=UPI003D0E8285